MKDFIFICSFSNALFLLYRCKFLTSTIFLLSKEYLLMFLARQVHWQHIPLVFVWNILYFLFIVGSSKYVLNEKKKKDKLRQTLNLNHLLKVQNKTETFLKFFQKEM